MLTVEQNCKQFTPCKLNQNEKLDQYLKKVECIRKILKTQPSAFLSSHSKFWTSPFSAIQSGSSIGSHIPEILMENFDGKFNESLMVKFETRQREFSEV